MTLIPNEFVNRLMLCDCVDGMRQLPDGCVPMTLTSPPYDRLRTYHGHSEFDFEAVAKELWRITMNGGVVVWIVADGIVGGDQSGTSFQQCLRFKELGFKLHNTIVLAKSGSHCPSKVRYGTTPEFAFVFVKGKLQYVNLIKDQPNKGAGRIGKFNNRRPDGRMTPMVCKTIPPWRVRPLVWEYCTGFGHTTLDKFALEQTALMPERVAEDMIRSFSRPGELVFDPFAGAATVSKMALLSNRRYLGMEIDKVSFRLAELRIQMARVEHRRRLDEELGITPTCSPAHAAFGCKLIELPTDPDGGSNNGPCSCPSRGRGKSAVSA